jgi:FkbM family methyltransferase
MKQLLKAIFPKPIFTNIQKLREKFNRRNSPSLTYYQGDSESILQCCIAYNKYGGYCVPVTHIDRPVVQKILSGDVYEPNTIEFIRENCQNGDIIHAGTYFGDFLPALSQSCGSGNKIWAFEPNPESYRHALITTYINSLQNVELTNAGLGEKSTSLSMKIADSSGKPLGGGSKLIQENKQKFDNSVIVDIVTIDEIIPSNRQISIIQLDLEKFEQFALNGAIKTIQRCKPIIILETLPEEEWLSENLFSLGYRITGKLHLNTIFRAD